LSWAALRDRLRTSLWLVPVGFSILAAGLALGLVEVDEELAPDTSGWFLYGGQADGARELLSTTASSMLTIAGLVFSITILVLQLASSQFSPRILSTFLQDRVTQSSLGMFLGSFVYAMMLLPRVRSETDSTPAFVAMSRLGYERARGAIRQRLDRAGHGAHAASGSDVRLQATRRRGGACALSGYQRPQHGQAGARPPARSTAYARAPEHPGYSTDRR
jgi:hypothetical protein